MDKNNFIKHFAKTHFRIPIEDTPVDQADDGSFRVLEDDLDVQMKFMNNSDGLTLLPVFTDEDAYRRWLPDGGAYVGVVGDDLFRICVLNKCDAIEINPKSVEGFRISLDEIKAYLNKN